MATQKRDVPITQIKDVFSQFLKQYFNETFSTSQFSSNMKLSEVIPVLIRMNGHWKKTAELLVLLPISQRYLKKLYMT